MSDSETCKKTVEDPLLPPNNMNSNHQVGSVLRSIEFWPNTLSIEKSAKDCRFETFSEVLERANHWLCEHHSYRVLNCETAEKKVIRTEQVYNDQMHYLGSSAATTLIKGLRLWLTTGEQCFDSQHQLRHIDVIPRQAEAKYGHLEYETIDQSLDHFNVYLRKNPIQGSILTVETVGITIARKKWSGTINTEECQWPDKYQREKFYFLRIFYITGAPAHENIGLADFIPNQLAGSGVISGRPKFELFDGVLSQAAQWIAAAKEVRITNIQTVESKYCHYKEHEGLKINTMAAYEPKAEARPRVFFLRVSYVRVVPSAGENEEAPSPPIRLTCRTFRPNITRDASCCGMMRLQFEGLTDTTALVSDFITRAGVKPLCAQLLCVPQWYMERGDFNARMVYNGEYTKEDGTTARLSLMYLLRVYLDGKLGPTGPDYFDLPYESIGCNVL